MALVGAMSDPLVKEMRQREKKVLVLSSFPEDKLSYRKYFGELSL